MNKKSIQYILIILLTNCLIAALLLYHFTGLQHVHRFQRKGKIDILIRYGPSIYYETADTIQGFEYELASAYAAYLNVKPNFIVYNNISELLDSAALGYGDIASGAITHTPEREEKYFFGPNYYDIQQFVVYRNGNEFPKSPVELKDYSLKIVGNSSYEEALLKLKDKFPDIAWTSDSLATTEQLLDSVHSEAIDLTVGDNNIIDINRRYMPEIRTAFAIGEKQHLAWIINPGKRSLKNHINKWLNSENGQELLRQLDYKYYSYVELYDYVDMTKYHQRIENRLPRYEKHFKNAAKTYNIPWTLLAAQAYQESHWNRWAKSPTGVRGIMMLTQITAKSVGVKNRMDVKQSIHGGAKYLSKLISQLPDSIAQEDEINFALAAYNVGMGHIHDAQILARQLGYNPNSWSEIRDILPLLAQAEYYKNLKHGYARGSEPVDYVERINNYRGVLEKKVFKEEEMAAMKLSSEPENQK